MTVFGKILTFVILVLALAQAALHVMFHIAQSKYEAANQRMEASLLAANAMIDAQTKEINEIKLQGATALATKQSEADGVKKDLDNTKTALAQEKEALRLANIRADATVAKQVTNDADIKAREKEVALLDQAVKSRDEKVLEMIKTVNDFRQRTVKAEIEANSFKTRNDQLVEKIADMEKDLARVNSLSKGTGLAGAIPGGAMQKNPPQANVEGLITRTDPTSGMVTISIGSDSGVVKGHTLEVFRLNPPKYLGTIRILDSKPNEAVGKPVNKISGQILQGDHVAAKILGG